MAEETVTAPVPVTDPAPSPAPAPSQPEWAKGVPAKFVRGTAEETAQALAQSYTELERQRTAPAPTPTAPAMLDSIDAVISKAGLETKDVATAFKDTGSLTPEQYEAFAGIGFGKGAVDSFVQGQQAAASQIENNLSASLEAANGVFGSEDQRVNAQVWANQNLSETEKKVYAELAEDAKITPERARMASEWLKGKQDAATGSTGSPTIENAGGGTAASSGGYENRAELAAEMNSPKRLANLPNGALNPQYDPAYARRVEQRVAKTDWLG